MLWHGFGLNTLNTLLGSGFSGDFFPPVISRLDWSCSEAQTLSQQGCSTAIDTVGPETLPVREVPHGGDRGMGNKSGIVPCPESTTVDAMQKELGRREDITPWLSGKCHAGEQFVYNKRLRWGDETEMGMNFSIEASWPGRDSLKPHRVASISREAGRAVTGHYRPWGLEAGIVGPSEGQN